MLKNEEQTINIINFLVKEYRLAMHHGGDPVPVDKARIAYCDALMEVCNLNKDEVLLLYLKGKILADKAELEKHIKMETELTTKLTLKR